MSPAKDQDYLSEGMAEEIVNALVRIDGICVTSARAGALDFHDSDDPERRLPSGSLRENEPIIRS